MTTELVFTFVGLGLTVCGLGASILSGGIAAVWIICQKLEKINLAIASIRENYVTHTVCEKRQAKCPCVKDMEEFKKVLKIGEK